MLKNSGHDFSLLTLRLAAGGLMLIHGLPKLMKFFSHGEIQFADPIGIGATPSLVLAVFSEVLCSLALMIGYKTRLFAIPLAITMIVAAFIVHANDPWGVKEKAILYLVMYISLILGGSGKYSFDKKIR